MQAKKRCECPLKNIAAVCVLVFSTGPEQYHVNIKLRMEQRLKLTQNIQTKKVPNKKKRNKN